MSETDVSGPEAPKPGPEESRTPRSEAASTPATTASSADNADGPTTARTAGSGGSTSSRAPAGASDAPRGATDAPASAGDPGDSPSSDGPSSDGSSGGDPARKRRRRGSRGGRKRSKPRTEGEGTPAPGDADDASDHDPAADAATAGPARTRGGAGRNGAGGDGGSARGGKGRAPTTPAGRSDGDADSDSDLTDDAGSDTTGDGTARPGEARRHQGRGRGRTRGAAADRNPELPDRPREGRPASVEAAEASLVPKAPPPKPRIGDSIPPEVLRQIEAKQADEGDEGDEGGEGGDAEGDGRKRRRRRGGRGRTAGKAPQQTGGRSRAKGTDKPVEALLAHEPTELDDETLERRRGRERKGRAVGRYSMCVHVGPTATQIAVLEGRSLIEHYVSRPSDDVSQIHGNVYLARVQNVLPGMEAAFVDIGTPKNAVLYRGDVHYDPEDIERSTKGGRGNGRPRIEDVLRAGQTIICQVTKNPIGAKGARLTQEVSLPGRFVVLIPNSSTYGISKRLPDDERKRLRQILDRVKPAEHGVIVRTAAENVTTEEIEADVLRLLDQWRQIDALAKRSKAPTLLYREPDMAVRVIREEFSQDYRSVLIDDHELYTAVRDYVASISPELADRVEYYDPEAEALPLYERHHVHEQIHRALDRKVWLPSGGSLIVEHTEALTVIDVNTGKNVGRSSLEETVFKNNLEAAVEIARQLRLRDVGGIIVVDFIDMEKAGNRDEVVRVFRDALSRDKTRTQVFEISELGLCEMTRKRIGEGLLESFTARCPECDGRGVLVDKELLPD
jgi:ribonuclease E